MDTRLWEDSTVSDAGLTVQVLTRSAVNLALVHNGVPMIGDLNESHPATPTSFVQPNTTAVNSVLFG